MRRVKRSWIATFGSLVFAFLYLCAFRYIESPTDVEFAWMHGLMSGFVISFLSDALSETILYLKNRKEVQTV